MSNLSSLFYIFWSYLEEKNEWFLNYKSVFYSGLLFFIYFITYWLWGYTDLSEWLLGLLKVSIFFHIYFSLISIIHDYIYNYKIRKFLKFLFVIVICKLFILSLI